MLSLSFYCYYYSYVLLLPTEPTIISTIITVVIMIMLTTTIIMYYYYIACIKLPVTSTEPYTLNWDLDARILGFRACMQFSLGLSSDLKPFTLWGSLIFLF